jgi:hypothetical protein
LIITIHKNGAADDDWSVKWMSEIPLPLSFRGSFNFNTICTVDNNIGEERKSSKDNWTVVKRKSLIEERNIEAKLRGSETIILNASIYIDDTANWVHITIIVK